MMPRLIYLTGQPGSGKSTLMTRLTDGLDRMSYDPPEVPVAHDVLVHKVTGTVIGAEIGKRRELFSGTDALPSSVIERAIPWVQTRPFDLLLAEGARLSNKRFIAAARDGGYHVTLALLDHPNADAWRRQRVKLIGREQNPSWVKGRLSASRNLADTFTSPVFGGEHVTVLRGHPDELYDDLAQLISVNA